jgi:hypothetical protein
MAPGPSACTFSKLQILKKEEKPLVDFGFLVMLAVTASAIKGDCLAWTANTIPGRREGQV